MKEYDEKMGKMEQRIVDQNLEIKELTEKVKTLMGKILHDVLNLYHTPSHTITNYFLYIHIMKNYCSSNIPLVILNNINM